MYVAKFGKVTNAQAIIIMRYIILKSRSKLNTLCITIYYRA